MDCIAVAAVSARMLAEAGAHDGFEVVALDLFGDADTCTAASRWFPIGEPGSLEIDADATLGVLGRLARQGRALGWVAGSGFEGRPDLLAAGAACLPLIGTAPAAVRRVRDPDIFFDVVAACGLESPARGRSRPADPTGWLVKDAHGCGGWHIRAADAEGPLPPMGYFQREAAGLSMSALFVANRHAAVVLGFNELIVRPVDGRPHVYCGAIGPVALAPAVAARIAGALSRLAVAFELQGLASLDFLLDGDTVRVLELNPRPSASMALYTDHRVMAGHVDACLHGRLPEPAAARQATEGYEIVYARRPLELDDATARQIAAWPGAHDLPAAGAVFAPGDPICSLAVAGSDPPAVRRRLQESREALLKNMET